MDSRPDIFDRARRARQRDRMLPAFVDHDFLYRAMLDELLDRLMDVQRDLPEALVIGCPDGRAKAALEAMGKRVACADPGFLAAKARGGIQADEDALPFADDSFDLVVACGTLDSVNDLPGALILMRRALRPDGLMLAAFTGAGSLPRLKSALLAAEGDRPGQHVHPQVDVRSAGDLLSRAGFAMPVADGDTRTIRYGDILRLMHDLRGMGAGNALETRAPPLTRAVLMRAARHFADAADPDGRVGEQMGIIYLSGWKPDPSQAGPARRGSATVSLAAALKGKAGATE
ncbi:methyltransferase domain-containing protein [Sphingobium sp. HBC34]|uniref:Methyltransferase domain-containing protein n=1 Tax=Sphingobium cyanobacteriorum TaxID=3063954 RepID=A0ABT8ZLI9_9SPHN|nr:methyltransferase domain-containing protein [Sphingobium sp. HBC34]MDO7835408.1 methyltransferase domain-containing protein [Sphingobium sp. HBC34]